MGLKDAAQLRRDFGDAAVEEVAVGLHDDDPAILALSDAAEEQVLLPQLAEPGADVHGLVDGGVEAFDAGSDEEASKPISRAMVWVTMSQTTIR